jgi:putative transposase
MGIMSKESFLSILDRQQQSGLSMKDFCQNEGYCRSNFHYWKSKFGLTVHSGRRASSVREFPEGFAPVRLSRGMHPISPSANREEISADEIMISFPGGIQVHLRGSASSESAVKLISQIYQSHVLPE